MDVPIAANVLGTTGAVCWSIQLIPQIIINYRRHNTIGLQRSMMLLWACAGVPLGAYNIASNFNVALLVQPQVLTVLSLITWGQCFYYGDKWSAGKCTALVTAIGALFGGVEVAFVFALRAGLRRDIHWPVIFMGILSTVLLSAGVLRHYYDIYIHRTVRGISFIFIGIDAAGDVFSLVSVFFQPKLDILGMVIYATEFVLWCGVFACGGYYNLLPWIKMKLSDRAQQKRDERDSRTEVDAEGVSNAVELERAPSSTSVFRTSSSILDRHPSR
ncbi:G protein-like protein-coupled receptor : PQ-loop [Bisporella sp. PMI_857]|nr:G protein-like protein-coupled receptor : PQ-loop [Bisporella sp. PMI_857]